MSASQEFDRGSPAVGPLDGVRIVDVSTTFMGPYTTMLLARMGADVIKVESPKGDPPRYIGPGRSPGMGSVFINANTGKRGIVLNLKEPDGHAALLKILQGADIFVHNMRPKSARRLKIDADYIRDRMPTLIHCSMRGFLPGPYEDRAAYDDVIQAVSGIASVQGRDGPPQYVVSPMVDKTMGMAGAIAIQAALYRRCATGAGEAIVIPMFEFMVSWTLLEQQSGWLFDPPIGDTGYPRVASPERRPFPTKDGYVSVLIYTDRQWDTFFDLAGRSDMANDDRFASISDRTLHTDELYSFVASVMVERTTDEWLSILDDAQIACMPVNSVKDLFDDEHLAATDFFDSVDHPTEGRLRLAPLPFKFGAGEPADMRHAPTLGEHTREILLENGYSHEDVDSLIEEGVVREA